MYDLSITKTLSELIRIEKELALSEISNQINLKMELNPSDQKLLNISLDELDFPIRVNSALTTANLKTIRDVLNYGLNNLPKIKNFGEKSFIEFIKIIDHSLKSGILDKFRIDKKKSNLNESIENNDGVSLISVQETLWDVLSDNNNKRLFETSLDEFIFSARVSNALSRHELKTIGDVLNLGWHKIFKMKNVGKKSLTELKNTIEHYLEISHSEEIERNTYSDNVDVELEDSFSTLVENILSSSLSEKQLQIIKARYGYESGKKKTLEQIGKESGITRERVRQVIEKSLLNLKHPSRQKIFQSLLEHIESALLNRKGIISVNDLSEDKFFLSATNYLLRFIFNLITDLYEERYRIIENHFLTSLNDSELNNFHSIIEKTILNCKFPIHENAFFNNLNITIGNISERYLLYFLFYKKHIEISNGIVLTPGRLSIPQKVKLIMEDIASPMHFTEIAKLYKDNFGEKSIKTSDVERAIHTRIGDSEDFIIVGPGSFMLRNKFEIPDNINEIVETSKEILQGLNNLSDTKYLIERLKQKGINVGILNAYSLKPVLLEHPGFVRYSKFEIGLEEFADKYERRSLSDLMYDVLIKAGKPLHSSEIWKQISKQRGFPRYAIDQKLCYEPTFIRVAPSAYTVKEHISSYEQKYNIIVDFTKEWINHKGHAVSAFFVTEVLQATEEIKDLTIGLVEHVLGSSPEFIKLPNGFYELVNNQ